ncbi:hypothetical protein EV421DRAFT_1822647 [Armillaria borealis]|uniref:Uncharacterized protein n=1 Tax=Armillaria borealis TaxID=47425 RepID=A0AA39JA52_9AGAR|nr:hypothetical protein EV421DRAFT_1822647 [Armillaria borealis]
MIHVQLLPYFPFAPSSAAAAFLTDVDPPVQKRAWALLNTDERYRRINGVQYQFDAYIVVVGHICCKHNSDLQILP